MPPSPFAPLRRRLDAEHADHASRAFAGDRVCRRDRLTDGPEPAALARARSPATNELARELAALGRHRVHRLRVLAREWPAGMGTRIDSHLWRDRRERRAHHRHGAQEFGIDSAQIWRAFADDLDTVGARLGPCADPPPCTRAQRAAANLPAARR